MNGFLSFILVFRFAAVYLRYVSFGHSNQTGSLAHTSVLPDYFSETRLPDTRITLAFPDRYLPTG